MKKMHWEDVIGHSENIASIKTLIREKKMPHALLFVGPEGTGKFLVAQITAAALFCSEQEKPCGKCNSCKAFLLENHPDLNVIEPEGQTIKIEQIRNLQKEISLAPYLTDKRIVIVNHAEKMTLPSANSLLKTLEDPVGNVMFILIAENRQMILDTILSRCMLVSFQPLLTEELINALMERGLEKTKAEVIAHLAEGSFGKAIHLQENDDLELRNRAVALLNVVKPCSMDEIWQISQEISEIEREKLQNLILYFNLLLRDILILYSDETSRLLYNIDLREVLIDKKEYWTKRKLFCAVKEVANAQKMLKANGNMRLITEQFLIKLRDL